MYLSFYITVLWGYDVIHSQVFTRIHKPHLQIDGIHKRFWEDSFISFSLEMLSYLVLTVASGKKTRFCFPWEAVLFLIAFGAAKQIAILLLCKLPSVIHIVVYCFITDTKATVKIATSIKLLV